MVPRATIRKPACVECLYYEPRLLGVHPKTNSWVRHCLTCIETSLGF